MCHGKGISRSFKPESDDSLEHLSFMKGNNSSKKTSSILTFILAAMLLLYLLAFIATVKV